MSLLEDIKQNTNQDVRPSRALYRILDTVGDGTGTFEQANATPAKYFIQPPAGVTYSLRRMLIYAQDGNFNSAGNYGAITDGLTNGILCYIENDADGILANFTGQQAIKTTYQWGLLAGSDVPVQGAAGSDPLNVRWTFNKGCGNLLLSGDKGERFVMETRDDLSALDSQMAMIQGRIL